MFFNFLQKKFLGVDKLEKNLGLSNKVLHFLPVRWNLSGLYRFVRFSLFKKNTTSLFRSIKNWIRKVLWDLNESNSWILPPWKIIFILKIYAFPQIQKNWWFLALFGFPERWPKHRIFEKNTVMIEKSKP